MLAASDALGTARSKSLAINYLENAVCYDTPASESGEL